MIYHRPRESGLQKPTRWPIQREDVWRNAEGLGIDPASLAAVWPMWEGAGNAYDVVQTTALAPTASASWGPTGAITAASNAAWIASTAFAPRVGQVGSFVFHYTHTTTTTSNAYLFYCSSYNVLSAYFQNGAASLVFFVGNASSTVATKRAIGRTSHYALTWNVGQNRKAVYEDGIAISSGSATAFTHTGPTMIGGHNTLGSRFTGGPIHGVSFWSSELTPAQVAQIYARPYALLARPAHWGRVFVDMGAGGTTISIADAGAGADALAGPLVMLGLADAGAGTDAAPGLAAGLAAVDAGSGTEALAVGAALAVTDAAAGTEALGLAVALAVADAGAGAEVAAVLSALLKQVLDAGAGQEAVGLAAWLGSADGGAGAEAVVLQAVLGLTDAGTGADLAAVLTAILQSVADAAAGVEAVGLAARLAVAEAGSGTDVPLVHAALSVADLGSGADAVERFALLLQSVADAAVGTDALALSVTVPVGDAGSGLDLLAALAVVQAVADAGAGVDWVIRLSSGEVRRLTITLRGRGPGLVALGRGPGLVALGRGPGVTFH